MFGQATLRRIAAEERRRATLRCELLKFVVADRAGVGQVEDPHFFLLAQPPGALAGLGEEDEVLGYLEPDNRVYNLGLMLSLTRR
jgi:hypothetical protein